MKECTKECELYPMDEYCVECTHYLDREKHLIDLIQQVANEIHKDMEILKQKGEPLKLYYPYVGISETPPLITKYKPIEVGDSYGVQFLCSRCDFPKNETLVFEFKYCPFCGAEIDWSEWDKK